MSNVCRYNAEFIERVGEHNIILFNKYTKFSNEFEQIQNYICHILHIELIIVRKHIFFTDKPIM